MLKCYSDLNLQISKQVLTFILLGYDRKDHTTKQLNLTEITLIIEINESLSATILERGFYSWSSCKGRKGNALALRADEGRDKLRKASGSRKWALIRRFPNGETRQSNTLTTMTEYIGYGGEPPELKHLSRARKRNQPRFRKQWRANAEEAKPEVAIFSGLGRQHVAFILN